MNEKEIVKIATIQNMEKVLDSLDVDTYELNGRLTGPCPVHGGDNTMAFNVCIDQDSDWYGAWFCNTRRCEKTYGTDVFALIRGILSRKMNKEANFKDVMDYVRPIISLDNVVLKDRSFDKLAKIFQKREVTSEICNRSLVQKELEIPCPYFTSRGFSKDILNKFSIGLCKNANKPMYNRSIFPIFDVNNNDSVVGLAGRTIDPKEKIKWKFNSGFSSGNHLFGYNRAVDTIRRTNSVVLVEGQGDVLRMHEAGVTNTVGIFGCNLSDPQSILLENASVLNIILMLDNDKAGRNAQEKIFNTYKTMFNFIEVKYDTKDPGELSIDQIQQTIVPQIEKYI